MSKENTATERLSITANVVLLGSYLFMGVCLLAGAILVLTQPLPFAENPMVMKVGMGWVMIPVSLFIICSNIIKIVRRRNAIVIDENGITDNTDSMGSGFTPWEQISEVFLLRLKDDTYLCAVPTDYDSWASTRNRRQARLAQANKDMGFAPVLFCLGQAHKDKGVAPIRIQFKKANDKYTAQDGLAAVRRFAPEKISRIRKPKY